MQVPLEISYRGVEKTDALDDLIRTKADKLNQFCDYIVSCRIAIEQPQKHQQTGNPYRVRIDMRVPPGKELVVTRDSTGGDMHVGVDTVIRDAFDAAYRQLTKLTAIQDGEVKAHADSEAQAFIVRIFPEEGYGFIKANDGREFYFHRNSVLNDEFDGLQIGTGVRFVEEMGEKGPQASTVQVTDKPHL